MDDVYSYKVISVKQKPFYEIKVYGLAICELNPIHVKDIDSMISELNEAHFEASISNEELYYDKVKMF